MRNQSGLLTTREGGIYRHSKLMPNVAKTYKLKQSKLWCAETKGVCWVRIPHSYSLVTEKKSSLSNFRDIMFGIIFS